MAVPYALAGPNFILDDWFPLRNAHFDGVLAASGPDLARARPGVWLIYAFEFGLLGRHPMAIYLVQTALNVAVAVAILVLARRFLSRPQALCVSLTWVLLPNHGSLDAWASTMNIVVALLLLLVACLLLTRPPTWPGTVGVAVTLSASVLAYEATLPAALMVVFVIPMAMGRRPRAIELLAPWAGLAASAAWIVANWSSAKAVQGWADMSAVLPAHFGWGVVSPSLLATALSLIALLAIATSGVRFTLPSFRPDRDDADRLILVGVAVILLGTLPFVRYFYSPIGAGDRVNVVASLGAAITWTGIGLRLWRWHREAAVVAAAVLVAGMVYAGVERDLLYARAGRDVLATLTALDEQIPAPDGPIAIGPTPLIDRNIVGLLDASNVDGALQLHRGTRDVTGFVTFDVDTFLRQPEHLRFDQAAELRGHRPVAW